MEQVGVKLEKYFCRAAFVFHFLSQAGMSGKRKSPTLYFICFLRCTYKHLLGGGNPNPVGLLSCMAREVQSPSLV